MQAPTRTPLRAVIFAVDSARTSGHATYVNGRLQAYGELDTHDPFARIPAMRRAIATAAAHELPVAAVVERPWGGFRHVIVSLSVSAALWADTWLMLRQPGDRLFEPQASDWRKALFGTRSLKRENARQYEAAFAVGVVRRDMPSDTTPIGGDAAAAICLGQVMTRSRAVMLALGCSCL
jgi:hypothetical protein